MQYKKFILTLLFALLILSPSICFATPTFVQTATGQDCSSPFAATVTITPTTNNLMVVETNQFPHVSSGAAAPAISDTGSNTWNSLGLVDDNFNGGIAQWWFATSNTSSSITITVTGDELAQTCVSIGYIEYSGIATASPNDQTAMRMEPDGSAAADGDTSGAITTVNNGDLILGFFNDQVDGGTPTAGTGYTIRTAGNGIHFEERIQSSAGSIAATWTRGNTNDYIAGVAGFKAAAGAPPASPSVIGGGVGKMIQ